MQYRQVPFDNDLAPEGEHPRRWHWGMPTNAVPGVGEGPQEPPAGRPKDPGPDLSIFTLEGFGGRSSSVPVQTGSTRAVPGVGEDLSRPRKEEKACPAYRDRKALGLALFLSSALGRTGRAAIKNFAEAALRFSGMSEQDKAQSKQRTDSSGPAHR